MSAASSFSLHHACTGCGGSCRGVRVRLLPEEVAPIRSYAEALGVANPLDGDRLTILDGRCVFLDGDRCAIHARFGAEAKPAVCRQYPLVVLATEGERRVGLDPGCYTAWRTRDAAPLQAESAVTSRALLDPAAARQEAALLALLAAPGLTIAAAITALGAAPGFEERWFAAVRSAPLRALLARPDTGASVRAALAEPLARLDAADAPPALDLAPEQEAWALDVARRMVGLRLCSSFPFVPGVALLTLGGALVAGWSDARPAPFAAALAGWTRAMRAPPWWGALVPGPEAMRALFGR